KTAFWIGDCFVFTTSLNRLNYFVGGEIVTIAHMDRPLYLLGYMAKESRIYAVDKELNVVSYKLLLCVLEYQTAVMRRDFETADKVLTTIPKEQRTRVAHFLEKQGFKRQALAVSQDPDHKFDLALALGDLKTAYDLAMQGDSEEKWKLLSQAATLKSELMLAGECLGRARDYGGLLLLATCAGSAPLLNKLAVDSSANGHHNVHFTTSLLLGNVDACIDSLIATDRIPEAAFFARTHCPSQLPRVMELWKEKADRVQKNTSRKIAESLADPVRYENLFPEWASSRRAESYLRELAKLSVPASVRAPTNQSRNVMEELETALSTGAVTFDESGQAHLRGVPRKAAPSVNSTEMIPNSVPKASNFVEKTIPVVAPVLPDVSRKRTPSPQPPRPREPTPEPENDVRQLSDDDSDGLSREAVSVATAHAEPDVVSERPRPDVVPHHGGPDLLPSAAGQRSTQPEVVVDAGEVRWSDDDFGDAEDGGNDINLDDLNLDDED
ncbi:Coatomer subunit beta, partial [Trichostrongylus colubriformis]